jgi:arylsulfatase A-like enzyme
VFVLAKLLMLAGREVSWSVWAIPAYFWQDVAVGLAFWIVDALTGRRRVLWAFYAALACYAALNVPVARALSSPLTVPMWRAAGGPLLDSIAYYLTPMNLAAMAAVLLTAAIAPRVLARTPPRWRLISAAAAVVVVATGPIAARQVDTVGLHRNAITALITTITPRLASKSAQGDWRASPFSEKSSDDLGAFRGAAAGLNVVLVILESTGAQYLAPYGAPDDPMPTLSRLASEGILFEHAYAVYPESIKGLFATLCGRPPAFDVDAEAHARSPCAPLPQLLAAQGYRSALFHSGRFSYLGMEAVLGQQRFDTLGDAGDIGGNHQSSFGVDEPAAVEHMLKWIDTLPAGQRFFLAYLPVAGHHPYSAPEAAPFAADTDLGAYKNALHYGDAALGTFFDGLRQRGLDQRTVYVIVGDHAEAFGQHDGNHGHSLFIFEENIRVPLVIRLPDSARRTGPTRVGRVASVIDVAPTILDLAGLAPAAGHDGVSLLRPRERMALFFTDYSLGWLGLRDGCWKLMLEIESKRTRLYDLCRDPGETTDRSAEAPDRVDAYRERVENWARSRREQVTSSPASPPGAPR